MAEPELVAACMAAMKDAAGDIPATVKCRIGIDDMDPEQGLNRFVETVAKSGVQHFIIHARKAWLNGLSPKENRTIPPLDYDRVIRLKQDFPAPGKPCISPSIWRVMAINFVPLAHSPSA